MFKHAYFPFSHERGISGQVRDESLPFLRQNLVPAGGGCGDEREPVALVSRKQNLPLLAVGRPHVYGSADDFHVMLGGRHGRRRRVNDFVLEHIGDAPAPPVFRSELRLHRF